MGMEFQFAAVPFEHDGGMEDIYESHPERGEFARPKEGVQEIPTIGEESIPSSLGLSLNINGIQNVNNETGGAFFELTDGDFNQRYVLLAPRRKALERIRAAIPKMSTEFRRKFTEVLVQNAESALEQYGNKAALIIL